MTSFFGIPPITVAEWMAGAVGAAVLILLVLAAFNRVLLKMALRDIPRRRAQTVLILFGLMLATLITTASLAVGDTSAYSLQEIQVRQIGGVDEAFTRHSANQYLQGASTSSEGDFFTEAQASDVIARARSDHNVAAAVGVIAAAGSMVDVTTGVPASENVAVFGVPADFASVWGPLHSRGGATLDVASLAPDEVILGDQLAVILNAHPGDQVELYVAGHPEQVTVKDVLDTEVNPSIANHGPIVSSVLMPLASVRSAIGHDGYNLILLHNQGSGGLDDLGPNGATGDEVTRHLSAVFEDQQAAQQLFDVVRAPAVVAQIKKFHDSASFLDPDKDLSARLLAELQKPAMSDEFKALSADRFADRIMGNAIVASVPPAQSGAAESDYLARIQALQVDSAAAADLKAFLIQPEVSGPLATAANALPADASRTAITSVLAEAAKPEITPEFRAMVGDPRLQEMLGALVKAAAPTQSAHLESIVGRLDLYTYSSYKADAVVFAQQGGLFATAALLGISFFSIAVGVLLIFLIFVMLAAERRAEMGMSRAVGLKRRHLTQMFLFEGTAYTLMASVIGVVLGLGVGALMIRVLSSVFSGFYKGIDLTYHVEWTSVVIAMCLGILLTFVVVAFSAYKVSRLNIVAAIRDLDESEHRDEGLLRMFTAPFRTAWQGLKQLRHGHPLVFLGRMTVGVLGAIARFWWALFRRGPLTIATGVGLVALSLWSGFFLYHVELFYDAGVSLVIIGTGLLLRWLIRAAGGRVTTASRAGFTFAALGLVLFWGRPFGRIEDLLHLSDRLQVTQMAGGPEVFVLSAMMVLLASIWLLIYNSDLLIQAVMFVTGRIRSLAPITRTSMAYPMATKFRTGMAVAMFAIVTFIIVYMSVFGDVLIQNFGQADAQSGHWQIVAGSPDFNFNQTDGTRFPADIASMVQSDPTVANEVRAAGWENLGGTTLRYVRPDGSVDTANENARGFGLHVVDDAYLSATGYALQARATGYSSDRAAWDAVRDNTDYAIVDSSILDAANGAPPIVGNIKQSDTTFAPFQLQVGAPEKGGTFKPFTVTVVGLMTRPIWDGMYISTRTALASGDWFDPASAGQAGLGSTAQPLVPTGYYFTLRPGVSVNQARLDLARMLVQDELEPVVVSDQLAQQLSGILTLLNLITGFLALGLVVGIAGLGVISTRAVVERFQQIGMLRALGFRRALVQRSFLMESSLIAVLGLAVGALVGLWESYRFFVTDKSFGTVDFHIPAGQIALILLGAYLATLITTFLPARSASRIAPAEALRYE
jgi:putative ABC transport system permease protein